MKVIFNAMFEMTVRSMYAGAVCGAVFGAVFGVVFVGVVSSVSVRSLESFIMLLAMGGIVGTVTGGIIGLGCGLVIGVMVGFLLHSVYESSDRQMNYWVIAILSGLASFLLVLAGMSLFFTWTVLWFKAIPALIAGGANAYNGWRYARSVVADTPTRQLA
ncbi:MAG: hypothetical protein H6672_21295 [Anaerolineaceae bacterium]|nr:hypothetical protein [Anaerolineaceae bacterium]